MTTLNVDKFKSYIDRFSHSSQRSKDIVKNAALSVITKGATVLASLLLVPMTIHYVNGTQYGIWLTLSSIIAMVGMFDLGLGNGFRNRFAEAKAKGDLLTARQLLSTTYFAIGIVVSIILIIALIINQFVDWTTVLKVSESYRVELRECFAIVCVFTCLNMVANVFGTLLSADQKSSYSSVISGIGQYVSLLVIFILTKTTKGSLLNLAVFYAGIPFVVMLMASIIMFRFSHYRIYRPSVKYIKLPLVSNILQLGGQFFFIYLCLIVIFQVVNVVISREVGAYAVTQYNIAYKYFNILYSAAVIIMTPFWSAFTDAYTKKDYSWMSSMVSRLERVWLLICIIGIIMIIASPLFYKIWVGDSVAMSLNISIAMFFLIISQSLGNIFMTLINGIGTIRIQLISYVIFAIIAWPLFSYSGKTFGLVGIIAIPALVYLTQGILALIQVKKILRGTSTGIWLK